MPNMPHHQDAGVLGAVAFAVLEVCRPGGASCEHGPGHDSGPSRSVLNEMLRRCHVPSVTLRYGCSQSGARIAFVSILHDSVTEEGRTPAAQAHRKASVRY